MSMTGPSPQDLAMKKRKRHRLVTRLGLFGLFLSGMGLAGLMYFETTALAPGRAALVIRGGELARVVVDAGHVYRIPVLDRIVLIDLRPQPLPTIRHSIAGSDGARATIELRATWQVVDAGAYWRVVTARPEIASRQIETEIERALRGVVAGLPMAAPLGAQSREALAGAVEAEAAPALRRAGLKLGELRITSVQSIR
jgi:regulator of protease activity HflC (stomatin/prohibitin superfamily)